MKIRLENKHLARFVVSSMLFSSCASKEIIPCQEYQVQQEISLEEESPVTYREPETIPLKKPQKIQSESLEQRLNRLYQKMNSVRKIRDGRSALVILGEQQKIYLVHMGTTLIVDSAYDVSTGRDGFSLWDTEPYKTPTGVHYIWQKLGTDAEIGTLFEKGEAKGEKVEILDKKTKQTEAKVITRVLCLSGRELMNLGTINGSIYIHGTNHEFSIGKSASHGCIRMRNKDIIELYEKMRIGTAVYIDPGK